RMLAGLEDIDQGSIYIGGRDVTRVPPKDRDIAMVFQNYALYPHMTVAENMGFALKIAGRPKSEIQQRVQEAAKILDLEPFLDRRGEHGLRAPDRRSPEVGGPAARAGGGEAPRPRAVPRPPPEGPLRWSAAARRDGPGDRAPAPGVLHGRAAVQPGRQAARLD